MQDTYSVQDVMKRHKCARSTVFLKMKTQGLPRGGRNGTRSLSISGAELYKWELKHMPWLHATADEESLARMEEDDKWNKAIADHETKYAKGEQKEKPLPKKGWDEIRRDIKKKGALGHHGKKPVTPKKPS